jgi:sodium-dependent dicarboxylate transporter 2/3/5
MTAMAGMVVLLTEFTSNIATTAALLPVLEGVAKGVGVHPYLLMLPAVMGASCAFMLPAATAPNAIAMGSGRVTLRQMMRAGTLLNLLGTVWISLCCWYLGPAVLGIDLTVYPASW